MYDEQRGRSRNFDEAPLGTPCKTPSRSRSCDSASDAGSISDAGSSVCSIMWSKSLRQPHRSRSESSKKPLTIPQEPILQTALRTRSTPARNHASSEPLSEATSSWGTSLRSQCTPSRERSRNGDQSCSSSRQGTPTRGCRLTPWRLSMRGRGPPSTPGSTRSERSMSETSVTSRCSKMSTEDSELLEMESGRLRLKEMLKRNRATYRRVINYPDVGPARRAGKITVPHEFSLSVPTTPGRSRCNSEVDPDDSLAGPLQRDGAPGGQYSQCPLAQRYARRVALGVLPRGDDIVSTARDQPKQPFLSRGLEALSRPLRVESAAEHPRRPRNVRHMHPLWLRRWSRRRPEFAYSRTLVAGGLSAKILLEAGMVWMRSLDRPCRPRCRRLRALRALQERLRFLAACPFACYHQTAPETLAEPEELGKPHPCKSPHSQ